MPDVSETEMEEKAEKASEVPYRKKKRHLLPMREAIRRLFGKIHGRAPCIFWVRKTGYQRTERIYMRPMPCTSQGRTGGST